jgi:hypothetical protein
VRSRMGNHMHQRRCWLLVHGQRALKFPAKFLAALLSLALLTGAEAGPRVIEESFRLQGPGDSVYFGVFDLALDGNRMAVVTSPQFTTFNVWIYERTPNVENQWSLPILAIQTGSPQFGLQAHVALQGNILALTFRGRLIVAERSTSGWSVTADLSTPPGVADMGADVEIDNGTIVVGGETGNYQALIYRKSSSGAWTYIRQLTGGPRHQNDAEDFYGGDVDISGNTIVISGQNYTLPDGPPAGSVFVYTNTGGTWVQSAVLRYPLSGEEPPAWGGNVAVQGDRLVVSHPFNGESYFYRRINGVWTFASLHQPAIINAGSAGIPAEFSGDLIARQVADPVRGGGRVLILSPQGSQLTPVADLKHIEISQHDFSRMDISGRMVAASGFGQILIFDIPTDLAQPAIVQDNFQDGNANGWQPFTVSSWTVPSSGTARVYRQTTLASEARSMLSGSDWTQQSVSALIKPTAFDGADRWFGLATRFIDPANYYYVTLRSSNTILLRRMVNGVFTTLASGQLPVALNQTYNVRLEAIGTRLRVFVNGQQRLEAIDSYLRHGQAALLTYRTRADFDNVVITPNSFARLFGDAFHFANPTTWIRTGDGTWIDPPEEPSDPDYPDPYANQRNFSQTSTAGGARAHTGVATADQIVQTRVRPNTLTPTGWFGVMARYTDDGNYYYLKVGAAGEASIRKLVNGAIFELARAPFPISANTWYTLRLEVVGDQLRAYLNDRFVMEATDSSHATGKYGLVTYRAAATFDDVDVSEP